MLITFFDSKTMNEQALNGESMGVLIRNHVRAMLDSLTARGLITQEQNNKLLRTGDVITEREIIERIS